MEFRRAIQAARTLGLRQTGLYALYQLGLRSGLWKRLTPLHPALIRAEVEPAWLRTDDPARAEFQRTYREFMARYPHAAQGTIAEAKEIITGRVRLFGGPPVRLQLAPPAPLRHWTAYEHGAPTLAADPDIKLVWEPARLGLVYPLARAYMLTGDAAYAQCFWRTLAHFLEMNPANEGPNWVSAQEVAIRLIAILFGMRIFAGTLPPETKLASSLPLVIAAHAARIPPTMLYARAQHNNHLLTEATGLIAAGLALPNHPHARRWRITGWRWLEHGLRTQLAADGTYAQHSTNYHRLMLQTALWADAIFADGEKNGYAQTTRKRLAAATCWLAEHTDLRSGQAANLGSNDGANLFPLAHGGFADYRPTLQAAAQAFLGAPVLPPGEWDEFALWLNWLAERPLNPVSATPLTPQPAATRISTPDGWGSLRAARFTSRPAHADQLHVDIWRGGQPVTLDAGTYRYTAAPPWDNALARTGVHNTLTVNAADQMTRAGRFLWLDWAQARLLGYEPGQWVEAQHNGYAKLGILHQRRLEYLPPNAWRIVDRLQPVRSIRQSRTFRLHWLLADGDWQLDGNSLTLRQPAGQVRLEIACDAPDAVCTLSLARAGLPLVGDAPREATLGWLSPTYNVKEPALSLCASVTATAPLTFTSQFTFLD